MRRIFLAAFATLVLSAALAALAGRAEAYPQFQFSSGTTRCSQCHFSPAGGGLITAWGRDESGDTISLGGDGAFLHGAWSPPAWLALGADLRLAATRTDRRWHGISAERVVSDAGRPLRAPCLQRRHLALSGRWSAR